MSVRNRLITACSIALCVGFAGYSGLAMAQKPKVSSSKPAVSIAASKDGSPRTSLSAAHPAAKGGLLNLNTATAAELDALPSIGPKTAARIVEFRQKIGGFKKIEQLMTVKGVGEKNFLKLKDRITVGPVATAPGRKP